MKAINTFQPGNFVHIPKLDYKGVKQIIILGIENNQIKVRYTNGKTEAEGVINKNEVEAVLLSEKHLELLKFNKINTSPVEYIHSGQTSFKIQMVNNIAMYKNIPLPYVHQLQNLYFAVTGSVIP